jgi:hypothetical protein
MDGPLIMITHDALQTFRNAGIASGLMVALLAGYATAHGGPEMVKRRNEAQRFMSGGLYDSQRRLSQELHTRHPVGSDAGILLNRLMLEGFECQADVQSPGIYECVFSRPLLFQRVARLRTRVNTDGRNIASIVPSLDLASASCRSRVSVYAVLSDCE